MPRLRDCGDQAPYFRFQPSLSLAHWGLCVAFSEHTPWERGNLHRFRARAIAEQILLDAVADWVRKLGFGSYGKVAIRGKKEQPKFGQFNWDLTAPTYLQPFVRFRLGARPVPGFFVADAVLGTDLTEEQISYFVSKATIMCRQQRTRPFLAMLIADHFAPEAFKRGKKAGLILTSPDVLLGKGVSSALRELILTLTNAAAVAVKNPHVIEELFSKLSAVEGAALNLRGPLFEMLLAYCFRRTGNVDIGVQLRDPENGEAAEIDVLVKEATRLRVRACECKGYSKNTVGENEVKEWLETRVPRIRRFLLDQDSYNQLPMSFEFWTTGSLAPDAVRYLRVQESRIRKYQIGWKDGHGVRNYVADLKDSYATKILDEHYFRHPVTRILAPVSSTVKTGSAS
jgi:hypothetical protein